MDYFARVLNDVRASLGAAPRRLSSRNKVRMPWWSYIDNRFAEHIKRQRLLLREGDVVWGALVQVNSSMFTPGANNDPGQVMRARSPDFTDAEALSSAKFRLFGIKGSTRQHYDEQAFADLLADEVTPAKGLPVPRTIAGGIDCLLTEVAFERRHLPHGVMSGQIMPLLVHPASQAATIMVPHGHWPADFVARYWGYDVATYAAPHSG